MTRKEQHVIARRRRTMEEGLTVHIPAGSSRRRLLQLKHRAEGYGDEPLVTTL